MKSISIFLILTVLFCAELSLSTTSNVVELETGENFSCASQGYTDLTLVECYEALSPETQIDRNLTRSPKGCYYSHPTLKFTYFNHHESGDVSETRGKLCSNGSGGVVDIGFNKNSCTDHGHEELTPVQCMRYVFDNNNYNTRFERHYPDLPTGCIETMYNGEDGQYQINVFNTHSTGGADPESTKYCKSLLPCEDANGNVVKKGNKMKTCAWLDGNLNTEFHCERRPGAASACASTCNSCGKTKTELCSKMKKWKTCKAVPCCQWDGSEKVCKSDGVGLDQCYMPMPLTRVN